MTMTTANEVDLMLRLPGHRRAAELAGEALASRESEAETIAEEAQVLAACMTSIGRLPKLRREAVLDFLRSRLVSPSVIEVLDAIAKEAGPVINGLRTANVQLYRQVADLRAELRDLKKGATKVQRSPENDDATPVEPGEAVIANEQTSTTYSDSK
jgi:hypothetical protein